MLASRGANASEPSWRPCLQRAASEKRLPVHLVPGASSRSRSTSMANLRDLSIGNKTAPATPSLADFAMNKKEVLGSGTFAAVFACTETLTSKACVVKRMRKTKDIEKRSTYFLREVEALSRIRSKLIPSFVAAFEDALHFYIVMERRTGVDSFSFLEKQPKFNVTNEQAIYIVGQLVTAVRHIHRLGIV